MKPNQSKLAKSQDSKQKKSKHTNLSLATQATSLETQATQKNMLDTAAIWGITCKNILYSYMTYVYIGLI